MNETEARTLREGHNAYVKRLSHMSRAALAELELQELRDRGIVRMMGGPVTRDEFIWSLCELRYPSTALNEAAHVIGHQARGWSACNFCHDDDGTHNGHLCECDRHTETDCTACGKMAAFHFSVTFGDCARGERPILTDHRRLGHAYQGRMAQS
jgi:hypothetical protein